MQVIVDGILPFKIMPGEVRYQLNVCSILHGRSEDTFIHQFKLEGLPRQYNLYLTSGSTRLWSSTNVINYARQLFGRGICVIDIGHIYADYGYGTLDFKVNVGRGEEFSIKLNVVLRSQTRPTTTTMEQYRVPKNSEPPLEEENLLMELPFHGEEEYPKCCVCGEVIDENVTHCAQMCCCFHEKCVRTPELPPDCESL